MSSPALVVALALLAVHLGFGLWAVNWSFSALPGWYVGLSVLTGLLAALGAGLTLRATPEKPFWSRALLIGLGWGLPVTSLLVSRDLLRGEFAWFSIPLVLVLSVVFYGTVMASLQARRT